MIYVDQLRIWPTKIRCFKKGSCHLFADTEEELHEFAAEIGLKKSYFQNGRNLAHYDLNKSRRKHALALGASELEGRELLAKWKEIRTTSIAGPVARCLVENTGLPDNSQVR
jgi:hypothetical protein